MSVGRKYVLKTRRRKHQSLFPDRVGVMSDDDALERSRFTVSSPPPCAPVLAGLFLNPIEFTSPNSIIPPDDIVLGILGSLAPGPRIVGAVLNNALYPAVHTPANTTNPNSPITNSKAIPNNPPAVSVPDASRDVLSRTSYFASATSPSFPSLTIAAFTVHVPTLRARFSSVFAREPRSPRASRLG